MVDNLQWKDCQEGIKAFIEKKHPVWCHTDELFEKQYENPEKIKGKFGKYYPEIASKI